MKTQLFIASLCMLMLPAASYAQDVVEIPTDVTIEEEDQVVTYESLADSVISVVVVNDTLMSLKPLPTGFFMPAIYDTYQWPDTSSVFAPDYSGIEAMRWLEEENAYNKRRNRMMQSFALTHPYDLKYVVALLPDAPKQYNVVVNPDEHTITINEISTEGMNMPTITKEEIKKRHWIKTFNASLQFSQAYVSPNWYQGGNNNVNALLNIYYNVKLNQKFHPNLLFDNTFQYKLGINSAPDDTLRSYNISEDIFQINSVFGIKAFKKWYYSVTGQFKTQLVNSYPTNSNNLRSAFLSPGELNIGIGMTYNTQHPNKIYTFDASISPISYNLMICTNDRINPALYGIDPGKKTKSKFGSSAELKLQWIITNNIQLNSRFFVFTDYDRAYCDWENTMVFEINRFLTTQLFFHLRYDTDTPPVADSHWKKLQLKEILSLGFAYKFSTI